MGWPLFWTSLDACVKPYYDDWYEAQQRTQTGTEGVQGRLMRNVWWDNDPSETPSGREPNKQQENKRDDTLPEMPHESSHAELDLGQRESEGVNMQDLWGDIPAEEDEEIEVMRQAGMSKGKRQTVCRTAVGVKNRVDRLRALGNGQVPIVAATAWNLLTEEQT